MGTTFSVFDTSGIISNFNVGHDEMWMVNIHYEVYRRAGMVEHDYGTSWEEVPGEMRFVSTAEEGITWGIDPEGEVWRWLEGEISIEEIVDNTHHHWIHVPEKQLIKLDVGYNSEVVGIEEDNGDALYREGVTPETVMGTGWSSLGSGYNDVTVCANGQIWASKAEDKDMYFRTGIKNGIT